MEHFAPSCWSFYIIIDHFKIYFIFIRDSLIVFCHLFIVYLFFVGYKSEQINIHYQKYLKIPLDPNGVKNKVLLKY